MRSVVTFNLALATLVFVGCSLTTDFASLSAGDNRGDGGSATVDATASDAGDGSSDGGGDGDASQDECNAPGLIALWRMDDAAGTEAKDCSPNRLNGALLTGTAKWVAGHRGGGLELDGQSCLDMGIAPKLAPADHLTLALWISNITFAAQTEVHYAAGRRTFSSPGWRLGMRGNAPSFEIGSPTGTSLDIPGQPQALGRWIHLAATFEPGRTTLYTDGQLTGARTDTIPQSLPTSTTPFRVGCSGDSMPGAFMNGVVDDVRLYDRVLSPAEISALAQ